MTKQSTRLLAIVTVAVTLLICAVVWNHHSIRDISDEHQFDTYGHSPTDTEVMNAMRVYVRHNTPAGLFGEVTRNLYMKVAKGDMQMVKEVNRIVAYVAQADRLSIPEEEFAVDIVTTVTSGAISEAEIRSILHRPVSDAEALTSLQKHHPYMRLYFMAMTAASDRDFTEAERERTANLAEKAGLDKNRILSIIDQETFLLEELRDIMGNEDSSSEEASSASSSSSSEKTGPIPAKPAKSAPKLGGKTALNL